MNTNVYFVRHAHSTYTPDELGRPLSDRGKKEAEKVTEILRHENIDVVASSPYERARETVAGIAKYHELPILTVEGFRERKLAAHPVEDFEGAVYKLWHEDDYAFEGGESNKTAQSRAINELLKFLELHRGKNIVIGTHGNIMVLMMNYFDSSFHYEFWKELTMPDIYKLTFNDQLKLINVIRVWKE